MAKRIPTKSLKTVVERAFKDDRFYRALKRNSESALKKAGIRLTKKDMRKLKRLFGMRSVAKDFGELKKVGYEFREKWGFFPW